MNTMRTTILLLFPFLIASASAQVGIASHYPGDRGINYDPDVLFADDFESYTSPTQLRSNWNGVYQLADLRIATEAGDHYAGAKAVEMTLPISGKEISNSLNKNLVPAQDVVFLRAYTKFDAGYEVHGSNHDGLRLSAQYPGPGSSRQRTALASFFSCCKTISWERRYRARPSRAIRTFMLIGRNSVQPTATIGTLMAGLNPTPPRSAIRENGWPFRTNIQTSRRCRIFCRSATDGTATS